MDEPINTRSFLINSQNQRTQLISDLLQEHDEYSFDAIKKLLNAGSFGDFENELFKCQSLLQSINRGDADLNTVPSWMRAYARSISHEDSYTSEAMRAHRLKAIISTLAESSPQTRQNLWNLQTKHPEKFNSVWADFLADNFSSQEWNLNSVLADDLEKIQKSKPNGAANLKGGHPYTLKADHSYEYTDNNNLKHIIKNLNDTGLDLCIANNKVAILNSSSLTFAQSEALEQYFVNSGKWPENIEELNNFNISLNRSEAIKQYEDLTGKSYIKERRETGEDPLLKIMKQDNADNDTFILPLSTKIKAVREGLPLENNKQSDGDFLTNWLKTNELSTKGPSGLHNDYLHSVFEPFSQDRRDAHDPDTPETPESYNPFQEFDELPEVSSYDYIKSAESKENNAENRNKAIDELFKEFRKKHGPLDDGSTSHPVSDIDHGLKSITITFWPRPDAIAKNNPIDSKKHTQGASTQLWSMKISKSNPPKIGLFIPDNRNFSPDDAGAVLKYFQEMGCTTFTMPSSDTYGSDVYKAFLEASVKQRIPLKLKPDGMEIKDSDIVNIDKFIQEKMNCRPEQKIDFLLRWSRQLDGFSRWGKGNSTAATKSLAYLQQARFMNFNSMCAGALEGYMKEQVDANKWTDVDVIMAKIAMTQLVTEISKGQMGGKPWDPTFGCKPEEKAALKANVLERFKELHSAVNRQSIIDEIKAQKDDSGKDTKANQVSRVERRYAEAWNNLVSNKDSDLSLASLGVTINSKMFPTAVIKDRGYRETSSGRRPSTPSHSR